MFKKKNVFDKINNYLSKKGHEAIMSILLDNYNGFKIYVRFDYVKSIQAYKICWYDLDFLDSNKLDNYTNSQIMTKNMGIKLDKILSGIKLKNEILEDESVYGDKVEIIFMNKSELKEYVFSRFLPKKLRQLADVLVITFSYLPRGMECILEEILAPLSETEEYFNSIKPIKFDLLNDSFTNIFRTDVIDRGEKYFEDGHVAFLEFINNKYIALVNGKHPYVVSIRQVDDKFISLSCSCPCDYLCKHELAVIKAIRAKKFNNFYKVKFIGGGESLLEKITNGSFSLCCGIEDDNLLIVTIDNEILKIPILLNGKKSFEIIEDDDDLSLSKYFERF